MGVALRVWCVVVVASAAMGAVVRAQGSETHGWFAPASLEGSGATLLHLPPRDEGGARAGSAVAVRVLDRAPAKLAAWERSVYLLYAVGERLEIYSLRVSAVGVSGAWLAEPAAGAAAEPVLDLEGSVLRDAAGSGGGLAALGQGEQWRLWTLGGSGWVSVSMPESVRVTDGVWLVAGAATLSVLVVGDGAAVWRLDGEEWLREPLVWPVGLGPGGVASAFAVGGDVCAAVRGGGAVEVWSLGPGLVGRIASVGGGGELAGLTAFEGGRRLGLLGVVEDPGALGPEEPIRRWELTEVSLATGRVLYSGPTRHPSLEIGEEVRLLGLLMLAATGFVLFYLLRPVAGAPEPVVPPGFVLAPPGRRLAAGAIDGLLVGALVSVLTGVRLADIVLVAPLFGSAAGVMALALTVSLGVVYSTVMEWGLGRTVGKLVLGLRVVSVDPRRGRVGLMRTGARNVFRWALAPWAIVGLGGPGLRHRGDAVAGAGVVARDRRGGEAQGPG
ncbi:MAG: RDD family protein [Phycisphaerales bacterium]|nr:RDD family protein [Phycisphaerales bacterium]